MRASKRPPPDQRVSAALIGPAEAAGGSALLRRVGDRVRAARARLGMTRKALAAASGVSERYLAQLEGGTGNISILLLRDIAAATSLRLEDFVADGDIDADTLTLLAALRESTPEDRRQLLAWFAGRQAERGSDPRAQRITLIGLRGAGKSTLARRAAERLDMPFVELNREIEAETGLSVNEIFSLYGEQGYRQLEKRCLKLVTARHKRVVLAVAGGIVSEPETFDLLLRDYHSVWLRASPEEHMARVRAQGDRRPMEGNPRAMDELRAILEQRERHYARATATLDTSGKTVERSCAELCGLIESLFGTGAVPSPAAPVPSS